MKTIQIPLSALIALALAAPSLAAEQTLRLLPAASGDQVPAQLVSAKSVQAQPQLDHAATQFSWALDPDQSLQRPAPFVKDSREYWTNASARALASGFTVRTSAPGALVRLSPEGPGAKAALEPAQVVVRKNGREYKGAAAFSRASNAAELKAAGADFPEGTVAFRLREELGAGEFSIALADAKGDFLVHVFEPDSGEVLSLTTDRTTVVDGGVLTVRAGYRSASGKALERIAGVVASPSGKLVDLQFEIQGDGSYAARVRHEALAGAGPGLWEVHTFASTADGSVQRDAKTAFASAIPVARLAGEAVVAASKPGAAVRVRIAVEAASASRYDLGGVLYASDENGRLLPAAVAHSAAWLEPGTSRLEMSFDNAALESAGLHAPFELRELTLIDQATLAPIEMRGRALRFQ